MAHFKEGTLGQLIEWLEDMDPGKTLTFGFGAPHSDRGFYEDVAFTPVIGANVKDMLKHARSAVGKIFHGWKGGHFQMTKETDAWIANDGELGAPICKAMHEMWKAELES